VSEQVNDLETARVFLAIPFYCSNDREIFEYFTCGQYREELEAITGADLVVVIPHEMRQRGQFVLYEKVRNNKRFQMDVADLPCIFLEDDRAGWVALKVQDDVDQLRAVFKELTTAASKAGRDDTASTLAVQVRSRLNVDIVTPLEPQGIAEGDFQRIVNRFARFADPAIFRHELAKREARIARIDISERAVGTGWLVGPELLLTAYHNVSGCEKIWHRVTALFDHKYVPDSGSQFLQPGRRVKFVEKPLLASSRHPTREVELTNEGSPPEYLDFALLRLAERVGEQPHQSGSTSDQARGWFQLPVEEYDFNPQQGLLILGHPQLKSESSAYPLKLTSASPSGARLTGHGCRLRYAVNTEVGNSGSPIMDEVFSPLALHHLGSEGKPTWDAQGLWPHGFNQGIPLSLIVKAIRRQVGTKVCEELGIADK
jgi:hypothetical protein